MRRLGLTVASVLFATAAMAAQPSPPPSSVPVAPQAVAPATPAFEQDLLRFSEILGAVSWLDSLCGSSDPAVWRGQMEGLMEAQAFQPPDRRRYVDAFNRGYRTFASVHRSCSPRTRAVLQRYLTEGASIADRIDERFGRSTAVQAPTR